MGLLSTCNPKHITEVTQQRAGQSPDFIKALSRVFVILHCAFMLGFNCECLCYMRYNFPPFGLSLGLYPLQNNIVPFKSLFYPKGNKCPYKVQTGRVLKCPPVTYLYLWGYCPVTRCCTLNPLTPSVSYLTPTIFQSFESLGVIFVCKKCVYKKQHKLWATYI